MANNLILLDFDCEFWLLPSITVSTTHHQSLQQVNCIRNLINYSGRGAKFISILRTLRPSKQSAAIDEQLEAGK